MNMRSMNATIMCSATVAAMALVAYRRFKNKKTATAYSSKEENKDELTALVLEEDVQTKLPATKIRHNESVSFLCVDDYSYGTYLNGSSSVQPSMNMVLCVSLSRAFAVLKCLRPLLMAITLARLENRALVAFESKG